MTTAEDGAFAIGLPIAQDKLLELYVVSSDHATARLGGLRLLAGTWHDLGVVPLVDLVAGLESALYDRSPEGTLSVKALSDPMEEQAAFTALAEIVGYGQVAGPDTSLLTQPANAIRKALARTGGKVSDIDLFELNEAFASVVLKFQKDLNIPDEKLNVNGGAIAMGHPLGATGAMIVGTVLDELERRNLNTALVTLCIGVGMGTATIIERV